MRLLFLFGFASVVFHSMVLGLLFLPTPQAQSIETQSTIELTFAAPGSVSSPQKPVSVGAGASRVPMEEPGENSDVISDISTAIQNSIQYPRMAKRMGWSGKVVIAIVIDSHGDLLDTYIEVSSGFDLLDANALEAISSWDFPPGNAGRHELVIHYKLNNY